MEKPHFDEIYGIPDEYKEAITDKLTEVGRTRGAERIPDLELDKTETDLRLITLASQAVERYLQHYGRPYEPLPLDKVHLLKVGGTETASQGRLRGGQHSDFLGSVSIDRDPSDLDFVLKVFHELVHAGSYTALQSRQKDSPEDYGGIVPYRSGFTVISRDGRRIYFENINEAIVGTLERRFFTEVLQTDESFQSEIRSLAEKSDQPEFGRIEETQKLNSLIDDLWQKNQNKYSSRQDILDLFIKAGLTGHLLEVAHLIESTYGPGSFREIADNDRRDVERE